MFKSIVGDVNIKENQQAIPDYLEKHFKQKEALRKQKQMMGGDEDELRNRIRKVEEDNQQIQRKLIDTSAFKQKKERMTMTEEEEKYI